MNFDRYNGFLNSSVLILDSDSVDMVEEDLVFLWKNICENRSGNEISIPKLVEENSEELRKCFFGLIYDLGQTLIKKKSVIKWLEIRNGFSLWWMTILVEGNYEKSTVFYDIIRLFVLEELLKQINPRKVVLVSNNKALKLVVKALSNSLNIEFRWRKSKILLKKEKIGSQIYHSTFYPIQALLYLTKYLYQRMPLIENKKKYKLYNNSSITMVDYLIHLDKSVLKGGKFSSHYWGRLLDVLKENEICVNWIHFYVKHKEVPSAKKAKDLIDQFNQKGDTQEFHHTFDGCIDARLIIKIIYDYIRVVIKGMCLLKIKKRITFDNSVLNLWPILKNDWNKSMFGPPAIANCLTINVIERFLMHLPKQKMGIYLQENHPWEFFFIYAWRKYNHGRLVGVPHTTVRYWDLCYFCDRRNYSKKNRIIYPMPDSIAVNGPVAFTEFLSSGVPAVRLVEVEALRYLYLQSRNKIFKNQSSHLVPKKILICGDYNLSANYQILDWLRDASLNLPSDISYSFKPHPSTQVSLDGYKSLNIDITNDLLTELLPYYDMVLTSNTSSAAVDAYVFGLPVIQVLTGAMFNMSPLRGLEGANFVTNSIELVKVILGYSRSKNEKLTPYFFLDKSLKRWKKLLNDESV